MGGKEGTILKAKWPKAGEVDLTAIQQSDYLMEAVRDFRLKLIAAKTPKGKGGKGGKDAVPASPPTHCTAYVAKSYPAWQATVLDTLRYYKHQYRINMILAIQGDVWR